MATFSVSLFLPYTISFNVDNASFPRTPAAALTPGFKTAPSTSAPSARRASLFSHTPPRTPPGDESGHDNDKDDDGGNHRAGQLFPPIDPRSPSLHFARPSDPNTLARTDAHPYGWGRGRTFNQPRFASGAAGPAATILAYAQLQQDAISERLTDVSKDDLSSKERSRNKAFAESDWTVEPAVQGNGGCTNAVRAAVANDKLDSVLWVGTLGFPTEALSEQVRSDIVDYMENEHDALTILTDDVDFDGHYNRYCKTILWDSLNYQIPDHPKSKAYEDHSWVYYVKVNQAFADRVVQSYKHGDTIWVHDYHLLLVPSMIRKQLPDARIGFFLHTSFPSSEVFRCLAMRKHLLEGVLGANLVAFQAPEYAAHFLQTCSRLLVVEATERGVQLDDRLVEVTAVPIGVNPKQFNAAREEPSVVEWIGTILQKYHDKKLIVARDKLDTMRGVKQKLSAYEMYLDGASSEEREHVVFIQVATSTMNKNADLTNAIAEIVNRINSKYSTLAHQPLVFLQQDIDFSQYIALLSAADVLMVTPLRDGMNLTCHEYLLCQDGWLSSKKHGPLILSEFTGSASLFGDRGGNLAVNPWDYAQMARAIRRALTMDATEKERRYSKLMGYVMEHDGVNWVLELRERLFRAYDNHQLRDKMSVPRLSFPQLSEQYKRSSKRLFILGYEGTLTAAGPLGRNTQSPQRAITSLSDLMLASDGNTVYVSSSNTRSDLEQTFRQLPNLGLIAENGCFVRPHDSSDWVDLVDAKRVADNKDGIKAILAYYRDHMEGSWIEEKACGFTLHYGSAQDADTAERQAGDCAAHISDACLVQRMKAVPVEKAVVVEPLDVSKVAAAKWIMEHYRKSFGASADHDATTGSPGRTPFHRSRTSPAVRPTSQSHRNHMHGPQRVRRMSSVGGPTSQIDISAQDMLDRTAALALTPPHSSPEIRALEQYKEPVASSLDISLSDPHSQGGSPAHKESPGRLTELYPQRAPDFLMVVGADREDEDVYHWATVLSHEEEVENVVSVCISMRNTEASCTLTKGATGLLSTLQKLARL